MIRTPVVFSGQPFDQDQDTTQYLPCMQALAEITKRRLNAGVMGALNDDVIHETDQSDSFHHPPASTSHPSPSQIWLPYVTREVVDGNRKVMETTV